MFIYTSLLLFSNNFVFIFDIRNGFYKGNYFYILKKRSNVTENCQHIKILSRDFFKNLKWIKSFHQICPKTKCVPNDANILTIG